MAVPPVKPQPDAKAPPTPRQSLALFVGEQGNWSFFEDIAGDLSARYDTEIFEHHPGRAARLHDRIARWTFHRALRRVLTRVDIAFFEWASELLVPASLEAKTCAVVTRLHSFELYAWAPRVNWNHVDRVVLVSDAMRRKFCQLYPDHAHKAEVVYNGCALTRFGPPCDRPFGFDLGMLCTLWPRKRVYEMVLVLYQLKQRGYRPHLHVAGGQVHGPDLDEYYAALRGLTHKLGLEADVTYYDHVGDPAPWLKRVDIFISNSYWEGHQVALVEAMASGCHCLSHCWDGAEEVLPSENLFVTDAELMERIIEFAELSDEQRGARRARMRAIAAERFDIETTKSRIRDILGGLHA